jgi:hypothetical protein
MTSSLHTILFLLKQITAYYSDVIHSCYVELLCKGLNHYCSDFKVEYLTLFIFFDVLIMFDQKLIVINSQPLFEQAVSP